MGALPARWLVAVATAVLVAASEPPAVASTSQGGALGSKSDVLLAEAALACSKEEEAVAVVEVADPEQLRGFKFLEVQQLVRRGWWSAARSLVSKSHTARLDLTAPVRNAVSEVKREADDLLKWLNPQFAHPELTAMSLRWAQNTTAVMLVARFAARWEAPGASLSVFSTKGGRGHVDKDRTEESIRKLLRVNISSTHVEAEITADAGNARKRYTLSLELFDEVVPQRSGWVVGFQRAQGSMQMSNGALIPELQILLRKLWPGSRPWPRATVAHEAEGGSAPPRWPDAPGIAAEAELAMLRESPPRVATPLTCAKEGELFCTTSDSCVRQCEECVEARFAHSSGRHCLGAPRASHVQQVELFDEDLHVDVLGGELRWARAPEHSAESFQLHFGSSTGETLPGEPIMVVPAYSDMEPHFPLLGVRVPTNASFLHVMASNEIGSALVAVAPISDRVQPAAAGGLRFSDADPREGVVSGVALVERAPVEQHVLQYLLQWGRLSRGGVVEALAPKAESSGEAASVWSVAQDALVDSGAPVTFALESVTLPKAATHLLAFAVGPGGALSEPKAIAVQDAGPPRAVPGSLAVSTDTNPGVGIVSCTVTIHPARCSTKRKSKDRCDIGETYRLYWADGSGARLDSAHVAECAASARATEQALTDIAIPPDAVRLVVFSRNAHGERAGPSVQLSDNRADNVAAWKQTQVFAATVDGMLLTWRPCSLDIAPRLLETRIPKSSPVAAVAVGGSGGSIAAMGQKNGMVTLVDIHQDRVTKSFSTRGAVTCLALETAVRQMIVATWGGAGQKAVVELWDLTSGARLLALTGHTEAVERIEADWEGQRLASASQDGTVRLWSLVTGAEEQVFTATASLTAISVDWLGKQLLAASSDNVFRVLNTTTGEVRGTFQGHTWPVRHLVVDWAQMRSLSASDDGRVEVWDLDRRVALHNASQPGPVLALSTNWDTLQAMAIGPSSVALFDLYVAGDDYENYETTAAGREVKLAAIL